MLVFTRYPNQNFTWFKLKGITTIDEWIATLKEYARQGLTRYELYDYQDAPIDVEQFSVDDINRIIHVAGVHGHLRPADSKTALVANADVVFGLSRMYSSLAELENSINWETRVFSSLPEATTWLGKEVEKIVIENEAPREDDRKSAG